MIEMIRGGGRGAWLGDSCKGGNRRWQVQDLESDPSSDFIEREQARTDVYTYYILQREDYRAYRLQREEWIEEEIKKQGGGRFKAIKSGQTRKRYMGDWWPKWAVQFLGWIRIHDAYVQIGIQGSFDADPIQAIYDFRSDSRVFKFKVVQV